MKTVEKELVEFWKSGTTVELDEDIAFDLSLNGQFLTLTFPGTYLSDIPCVLYGNLVQKDHTQFGFDTVPSGKQFLLDGGAHVGTYSSVMALSNPELMIIACEPDAVSAEYLRKNITQNALEDRITVEQKALSSESRKSVPFQHLSSAGRVCGFHTQSIFGSRSWYDPKESEIHAVDTISLSDLFSKYSGAPRLLKLDIEGEEEGVLRSMVEKHLYPERIVVETHTPELKQRITSLLTRHNYKTLGYLSERPDIGDLYFEYLR